MEKIILPVLDLNCLTRAEGCVEEGELEVVVRGLERAMSGIGMVHIVGHGIPEEVTFVADREAREFFHLEIKDKNPVKRSVDNARGYFDDELTKNRRDAKQAFDYGPEGEHFYLDGENRWPQGRPGFRDALLEYLDKVISFARLLTGVVSVALGQERNRLDHLFEEHTSFLRFNLYGWSSEKEELLVDKNLNEGHGVMGVHHHTDAGFFTLLHTDSVPGLQVEHDGWKTVVPVPGALCFNVGDMLQVMSNDRFHSPLHRVLKPAQERLSSALFWNPASDFVITNVLCDDKTPQKYTPFTFGEFRRKRFEGDFRDLGKEVQIQDYRIPSAPKDIHS